MVIVRTVPAFDKAMRKLKDEAVKLHVKKQIRKIIVNPEIGKPMRYNRQGTREVYVAPFRLAYLYVKNEDTVTFLDLYHKDEQ